MIERDSPIRHAHRAALAAVILAWTIIGFGGCSRNKTGAGVAGDQQNPGAMSALELPAPDSRQLVLSRIAHSDNGLEVRKWIVIEDADRIAAAMSVHAGEWSIDKPAQEALRRNGLRLVRVNLNDMDSLLIGLGGATFDLTGWQGQSYEWCSLLERRLDSGGQALAVDGKVRRYPGGSIRLMARGWTLPTEDGPRLQLQIASVYHRPQQETVGLLTPRPGEGSPRDEAFASMALELDLDSGWAYVLTCESPQRPWTASDEDVEPDRPAGSPSPRAGAGKDEAPGLGPPASAPTTAGELMMRTGSYPPTRGMLVFVPRIPTELKPPPMAGEPDTQERARE